MCLSITASPHFFQYYLVSHAQGSILGPLLFIMYVKDLIFLVQLSNVLTFANDTKCYKSISSVFDSSLLQSDLDLLSNWSSDWQLRFNATKCHLLHFHMRSSSIIPSNYCVNGSSISTSNSHKDLGIIFSDDLSWSSHYHYIPSRAYNRPAQPHLLQYKFHCNKETAIHDPSTISVTLLFPCLETLPGKGFHSFRKHPKKGHAPNSFSMTTSPIISTVY